MKILAINGSPRGKKSVTYLLIEELFKGAKKRGALVEHLLLAEKKIHPCIGCFSCWKKPPYSCVFQDDFTKISQLDADILIYGTPLYVDNVSGLLKNFMDRFFALLNPLMEKDKNGEAVHPLNGKKKPSLVVVANSGYPGQENFCVLDLLFERIARNGHTQVVGKIFRDMGPLFHYSGKDLGPILEKYKQDLQEAGEELVLQGFLSKEKEELLKKPLIDPNLYLDTHNAFCKASGFKKL